MASMTGTGAPRIGTTYPLQLSAVTEAGQAYVTALTMNGLAPLIRIGRRFIPLAADSLFFLTLSNVLPGLFVNFQGVLGSGGTGQARLVIPNLPPLVGIRLDGCFITYDSGGVRGISNPWGFRISQ
jgi:hypothetical protein